VDEKWIAVYKIEIIFYYYLLHPTFFKLFLFVVASVHIVPLLCLCLNSTYYFIINALYYSPSVSFQFSLSHFSSCGTITNQQVVPLISILMPLKEHISKISIFTLPFSTLSSSNMMGVHLVHQKPPNYMVVQRLYEPMEELGICKCLIT
jgi:hypothetical protein